VAVAVAVPTWAVAVVLVAILLHLYPIFQRVLTQSQLELAVLELQDLKSPAEALRVETLHLSVLALI
jgi:hypothetical protein